MGCMGRGGALWLRGDGDWVLCWGREAVVSSIGREFGGNGWALGEKWDFRPIDGGGWGLVDW